MGNLSDTMKQANEKYGGGSNWLNLEQGENGPFRLLSAPTVYAEHFSQSGYKGVCIGKEEGCEGCKEGTKPTPKWLSWVSEGNNIKLAKFGYSIIKQLSSFQDNPEYAFTEYPMPWTFTVKKTGEKLDTEYSVVPARANSEASTEILVLLGKEKTPEEVVTAMKEKKGGKKEDSTISYTERQKYNTDEADDIASSIPF